jgi:alkylation response protein AidB-like acyl-CoA dehydrogenase
MRRYVRDFLDAHPQPTARELAEAGLVAPHWPRPWGLDADPVDQLVIDDELERAGVERPANPIGIGWAGPTLLVAGSEAQKRRYLPPMLAGEEIWCQLFSEPDAGSDLASLRTTAVRDGDEWVVTGQKIWTTGAHLAAFGILLARTDPEAPRHRGISYFICPMRQPGVEVRPIVDMTGDHAFNQVFLNEARIPKENLVGPLHGGWALARVTLANERVSLSGQGALWGGGPTASDLVALVRAVGRPLEAPLRDRLASVWIEGEVLRVLGLRLLGAALAGQTPGPEASVRKALGDDHGQRLMLLAKDLAGAYGMLAHAGPLEGLSGHPGPELLEAASKDAGLDVAGGFDAPGATRGWRRRRGRDFPSSYWAKAFLFSRALTIGGGTAEVQRNVIGERVLGLPRDPEPSSTATGAGSGRSAHGG